MRKFSLLFKDQFDNDELAKKAIRESYNHVVKSGIIATVIISVFELIMFGRVLYHGLFESYKNLQYGCCYAALFFISFVLIICMFNFKSDIDKYGTAIYYTQVIYSIAITIWAVCITLLDGNSSGDYDVIVFMTILLVVPILTFMNPVIMVLIQLAGDAVVFDAIVKSGDTALEINFAVYIIISIVAGLAFHNTKKNMYINHCQLIDKATRDPLSGIYNRQKMIEDGNNICTQAMAENKPIAVIMADIDHFKKINDTYGHVKGDYCIKKVAMAFELASGDEGANCYRYGGEEFVMLLQNADKEMAITKTEEIMRRLKVAFENDELNVTSSFGIYSDIPTASDAWEKYISKADDLLYQSKQNGRNCYTAEGV